MIAVDSNVLIHAYRLESPDHPAAFQALQSFAAGPAVNAIPWPCIHEFLAVVTNQRAFTRPTPASAAIEQIESLLRSPYVVCIGEGDGYFGVLADLVRSSGVMGGAIHDARIAAICLRNGVSELLTADRDFSRFPGLKTRNPLVS